jgi:hypothetical protein
MNINQLVKDLVLTTTLTKVESELLAHEQIHVEKDFVDAYKINDLHLDILIHVYRRNEKPALVRFFTIDKPALFDFITSDLKSSFSMQDVGIIVIKKLKELPIYEKTEFLINLNGMSFVSPSNFNPVASLGFKIKIVTLRNGTNHYSPYCAPFIIPNGTGYRNFFEWIDGKVPLIVECIPRINYVIQNNITGYTLGADLGKIAVTQFTDYTVDLLNIEESMKHVYETIMPALVSATK